MVRYLPDLFSVQRAENMDTLLGELKKFVSLCGWTYAVIWTIGPDHRTPVWYLSYFNEVQEREIGQAQRFESVYKRCHFTAVRPGYAYMAWHRQSPYWWLRPVMEPIPTDENKELFLTQAKIQTLVCFPGRAPADGTGYCVELASTSQVPETEFFKASIRDFISTSIAPHITGATPVPESYPLLQEVLGLTSSAQALVAAELQQDTAILTDISSQAAIHGEDEAIAGFSNIVRPDEPYYPWTMSSSHYVSADHYPSFDFSSFDVGTFGYGGVQEPFQNVAEPSPEWPPSPSNPPGSRKGKEIDLVEPEQELGRQKQTLSFRPVPSSQCLSLLQLEYLENLKKPASGQDSSQLMIPSSEIVSSGFQRPSGGQAPPRDSPWVPFQTHRQSQSLARSGGRFKRPSLIYKWATALAPRMRAASSGGGGAERQGGLSDPAAFDADPRSPNSRMLDQQAAVVHKIAERKRRSNMNNKLRTLSSIVPIIDKKDKVSVLTSTIDYIRQLTSRISSFENKGEASTLATTSRVEEEAVTSVDKGKELALVDSVGVVPSSEEGALVVVQGSPNDETWLIKVQANYHSRSLLQLLNVFQEHGLEIISVDYGTINGRFHASISIKHSKDSSINSNDLKQTLCRVLEFGDNLPPSSD